MKQIGVFFALTAAALGFALAPSLAQAAERGIAAYYEHKTPTATGEYLSDGEFTAAHRTLPFGTRVRVTHAGNGRTVVVRINDRGPFTNGRIIDVSKSAAQALGMVGQGIATVQIEVMN
jgi:rare lipoprotein A